MTDNRDKEIATGFKLKLRESCPMCESSFLMKMHFESLIMDKGKLESRIIKLRAGLELIVDTEVDYDEKPFDKDETLSFAAETALNTIKEDDGAI